MPLPDGGSLAVFLAAAFVLAATPGPAVLYTLFFLAFLSQFADPAAGSFAAQVAVLGVLFLIVALSTDAAWGLLAGSAGAWLRARPGLSRPERYVTGSVYLGLGLAAALSGDGRK